MSTPEQTDAQVRLAATRHHDEVAATVDLDAALVASQRRSRRPAAFVVTTLAVLALVGGAFVLQRDADGDVDDVDDIASAPAGSAAGAPEKSVHRRSVLLPSLLPLPSSKDAGAYSAAGASSRSSAASSSATPSSLGSRSSPKWRPPCSKLSAGDCRSTEWLRKAESSARSLVSLPRE